MDGNRAFFLVLTIACCVLICGAAAAETKTVVVKIRVDNAAPGFEGYRAMDGNPSSMWHTSWQGGEPAHPHEIIVDLGASYEISGFTYLPRPGGGNGTIKQYECFVSDKEKEFGTPVVKGTISKTNAESRIEFPGKVNGRYLRLRALSEVAGNPWTSVAELGIISEGVEFRARESSTFALALPEGSPSSELDMQFAALVQDLRNRAHFVKVADQVFRPESMILESDRCPLDVVLRRTAALLADMKYKAGPAALAALEKELDDLSAAAEKIDTADVEARLEHFKKVCKVRRKIAFSNPLLDFNEILFVKRHRPGFNHMCDQYYGINAKPGGGLYVLSDPFGQEPQVRDVLADCTVERGRLKGKRLESGSFVAPDLSYDGREIAFAYVECRGDRGHRRHTDPGQGHWDQGWSYHVFRVDADGSHLE